ncbi:RagB/SusD family nutrient uptake outer membrane protein [bacterium]|nr:RagB/SusD family nutrient uptake outer membrane protein [Bacteroidales bacterium]MBD5291716.1 RagB/SusD family nutrient uptake outer membrane protein [Bacteroides sp.]MBD5338049.1 RagB/SusD family nutrient uptake outer membrane protein [Bacteroides sp.]MBD5385004.1 RagB/SusD family nutrient uptake outer membrane protein [bacterium]MDE7508995.1 RagB/SusD family nutrient uptake outer membrane protein [Muribaculaceae bacterium]
MNFRYILPALLGCSLGLASCSLDYEPVSDYSDVTEGEIDNVEDETVYQNRADAESALTALYEDFRNNQNYLQLDFLLIGDVHSDNAYAGTTGSEVVDPATNDLNGTTLCVNRDWNYYMLQAAKCTKFIIGVASVGDNSLSQDEINTMRAQAEVMRAFIWFRMVRMWGNIPIITTIPKDITSENIQESYESYFPAQNTEAEAYEYILKDLEDAYKYAPDGNGDKTRFSKDVARALLAKVYAERPVRDYAKVIKYVDELTARGYALCPEYGDLFNIDGAVKDGFTATPLYTNTVESILEVHYPVGSGNWASWMYGRCLEDWDNSFSWAKWITPSRDLLSAFDKEGDTKRKEQTVVYYECAWSNYYPSDNYAFMYKVRSGYSNIFFLRYDDVLLLKAEALLNGDNTDLAGAAEIIDRIRTRAGVAKLTSAEKGSKENLMKAYINERRLELACEGERWYDLVRLGILEETMAAAQRNDPGRLPIAVPYTVNSYLLPIPQDVLDTNPNVVQNPGY